MKKLFTFVSLMAFASAMYAQDPSKWSVDQNVAEDLGLKELGNDFSGAKGANEYGRYAITSIGNVWKGDSPNEYRPGEGDYPAVFGFYSMGLTDFYQIVRVPAGSYTFRASGFYREGTPADNFDHMHRGGKFPYGHMYANILADDQTTVTYENDLVMKTIAESDNHEGAIHTASDWMNDHHDTYVDKDGNKIETWCPSCCEGFSKYFEAGKYLNEKRFVLTEDAYVKFGFRKTGAIKEDCLDFGNIQVIYNGPATDESLRELAIEELGVVLDDGYAMAGNLKDAGFEALSTLLSDLMTELDEQAGLAETAKDIDAIKLRASNAMNEYYDAKEVVLKVAELIKSCNFLVSTTQYPGYDEFKTAVEAQKAAADETDAEKIGVPAEYYDKIVNALAVARATYLDSQVITEDKGKDFTPLVDSPWFVNIEYTPVNEGDVDGQYWHLTEESWTGMAWDNDHQSPGSYKDKVDKFGLTNIASNVVISSDRSVKGQWFKYQDHQNGWCAGTQLWHVGRLVGFSTGWASTFKNSDRAGIEGVAQRIVGLPNGYYTVSCLVRGWDAIGDYSSVEHKFLGCFAENSKEVRVTSKASENYTNDVWYKWESTPGYWDDVETDVITVDDGELLIGGGGSVANVVTGFRLNYFGNQPNFTALAQRTAEELKPLIKDTFWAGDIKKLNDLLNSVKYPIIDAEAYDVAAKTFREFSDYVTAANKKYAEYTAKETIGSDVLVDDWASPAFNFFNTVVGTAETDTYDKIDAYNALANAYKTLGELYVKIEENFSKDATLKNIVAAQKADLKSVCAPKSQIDSYISSLSTGVNLNIMQDLGCANATEATPVTVSVLINNPTFDETTPEDGEPSINKSGWTCAEELGTNAYARGNVELWNKNPFTLSQKIENLPAGTYKLRVKAIYRDSGSVSAELKEAFEKAGGEENWEHHNAVLFAKTSDENVQTDYIKSIYRINQTSLSFTEVATSRPFVEGGATIKTVEIIGEPAEPLQDVTYYTKNGDNHDQTPYGPNVYPFDSQIGDNYYPASMYGFYMACQQHPEAITSEVTITIEEGETLEIGIKKDTKIDSDWVIFDDFELEFLSGESFVRTFNGVENVTVNAAENGAIFNLAGQKVNGNFKGIVIKNGAKVLNK